jgi:hypothetical protein
MSLGFVLIQYQISLKLSPTGSLILLENIINQQKEMLLALILASK